ncbi:MAG: hypothetical protein QOC77_2514 [Thermoleophilaceae bacterium]|jgi:hypothetical protein|nr:hypothetical protein [Thermoleophilaceae bacterium]
MGVSRSERLGLDHRKGAFVTPAGVRDLSTPSPARQTLAPPARAPFPRRFEVQCRDVHPVRCDATFRASSYDESVARARAHGASVHGFTPEWDSAERLASIAREVTG